MKRCLPLTVLLIVGLLLAACAPATPQVIEKIVKQTVVVEQEKVVAQTVIVAQTKVVEKEKQVVVTATPVPPTAVPKKPTEKQYGGTVNVWMPNGWPGQSWIHISQWEIRYAISPMAEALFWPLPDGTLQPVLATAYEASPDGLMYTVHLRKGVKWHDGQPFTAADVLYTYNLRYGSDVKPPAQMLFGLTIKGIADYRAGKSSSIAGIQALDDFTVRYTLASPDAGFANLFLGLQDPIVPKHAIEKLDPVRVRDGTADYWYKAPIGTGPFKFVKYATDQYIEYARFDDYWGGKPGPEKLFLKISSPEVAVVSLQKGEIDFINQLQLTEAKRLTQTPGIEVLEAVNKADHYGLEINSYTKKGLWTNPKAKQAFLYGVNRQFYVDSILQGYGKIKDSYYDGSAYACPTMTKYTYDPAKAKALFDEVGMNEAARKETVISMFSWLGLKARQDFLPIAQENLRQLGFKANVDIIDNALVTDYLNGTGPRGHDEDFWVSLKGGADPGWILAMIDSASENNAGIRGWPFAANTTTKKKDGAWVYKNERMDALIAQAKVETDPAKRVKIYQDIDCIWNQEMPILTTAAASFVAAKTDRLQGVNWKDWASLGNWMLLYRPGDWWVWPK